MESGSLVAKALFTRAQSAEVLGSLRDRLSIKADDDSAQFLISVRDVEKDLQAAVN